MTGRLVTPIEGQHYWITRKRLSGAVICKWCGLTRGPAAKARRCEPIPQAASRPTSPDHPERT